MLVYEDGCKTIVRVMSIAIYLESKCAFQVMTLVQPKCALACLGRVAGLPGLLPSVLSEKGTHNCFSCSFFEFVPSVLRMYRLSASVILDLRYLRHFSSCFIDP
jgi:hypothetical protein